MIFLKAIIRTQTISTLKKHGFEVIVADGRIISIENAEIRVELHKQVNYTIFNIFMKKLDIPKFRVVRRGFFETILGDDSGDVKYIHNKYKVFTPQPIEILKYITKREPQFFEFFEKYRLRMKLTDGTMEFVLARNLSPYQLRSYTRVIDDILLFRSLLRMEPKEYSMLHTVDFRAYTCYNCKNSISYTDEICTNCNTGTPVCIICLQDPRLLDEISMLSCCESYAHTKHLDIWFGQADKCPYCGKTDSVIYDIIDTEATH